MKRFVRRPSPATAISCIALFVALGGVSYGVSTGFIDSREILDGTIRGKDVRDNNLTTKDLRNNEVYGIDIRNNTIRGRDIAPKTLTDDQIDESKLTQVAGAVNAAQLGGLAPGEYARSRSEAVTLATLEPGVTATGFDYLEPGFWRDSVGTVHLQGSLDGVTDIAFTLPAGYRPAGIARFHAPDANAGATVQVALDGDVHIAGADGSVSLDGITFRAAN